MQFLELLACNLTLYIIHKALQNYGSIQQVILAEDNNSID